MIMLGIEKEIRQTLGDRSKRIPKRDSPYQAEMPLGWNADNDIVSL
jgi:hypothetical protein